MPNYADGVTFKLEGSNGIRGSVSRCASRTAQRSRSTVERARRSVFRSGGCRRVAGRGVFAGTNSPAETTGRLRRQTAPLL